MSRKRVVVADDLPSVLSATAAVMSELFEVVGTATDGRAAIETTLRLQPDLVVLDISMPIMSGIEVAQELKRIGNDARIVFLTVNEDPDILKSCQAAGGLGYVLKMLMDTDLPLAVNAALEGHAFTSRLPSREAIP